MEQDRRVGGPVQAEESVLVGVAAAWAVTSLGAVPQATASVHSVAQLYPIHGEYPATLRNAPSAEPG